MVNLTRGVDRIRRKSLNFKSLEKSLGLVAGGQLK